MGVWVCICVWGYCQSIAHAGSKHQDNTVTEDINFAFGGGGQTLGKKAVDII